MVSPNFAVPYHARPFLLMERNLTNRVGRGGVCLKKPANISVEEKQALAALESEDAGFVHRFRSIIRQLVNIFDHSHSEAQAKIKLKQLRQEINAVDDDHLQKSLTFFDDHGDQALRYRRQKGMGKH